MVSSTVVLCGLAACFVLFIDGSSGTPGKLGPPGAWAGAGAGAVAGAGAGANPWLPPWVASAPWFPQWSPCTTIGPACNDCNSRIVCTKVGGLVKPCTDPLLPNCNLGACSETPSAECAPQPAPAAQQPASQDQVLVAEPY